jgi:hypothetical protein|eukprot:scaffold4037_cov265-Chaetoceros_neogracile.AAC.29
MDTFMVDEVQPVIEKSEFNDRHETEDEIEICHASAPQEQSTGDIEAKPQAEMQEEESTKVDLPIVAPKLVPAPVPPVPAPRAVPTPINRHTPNNDIEEANDEIAKLLLGNRISVRESSKLQSILRESAMLKEKVAKLKILLARSSKASKDTKQENLEYKRLLDVAKKEVDRLNSRVEAMASRPTHMDLLADFETNFDRALMNLHSDEAPSAEMARQSVGQATEQNNEEENVSNMLMAELNQTKGRIEHLESMNTSLKKRSIQLEIQNGESMKERESGKYNVSKV